MTPEPLPVIFRADRTLEHGIRWITAVFPTLPWSSADTLTIYQHVGQHGSADRGWYNRTRAATPAEYRELLQEVRSIYRPEYRLIVRRRMSRADDRARADAMRLISESGE